MQDGIRRRIEQRTGVTGLDRLLADKLSPGDLQSLLLEVYARRHPPQAGKAVDLLRNYRENRFSTPSPCRPRQLARLHLLAWDCLPECFEALELSPLSPLGCCSAVATVHQNKVVSTIRSAEVSSDPSNQLALECSVRRRDQPEVHLAASQRVVRAQALPKASGFYAHFQLLALASAARCSVDFEREALAQHLGFYLTFLGKALPAAKLSVKMTELARCNPAAEVYARLTPRFPRAALEWDPERSSGRNYYLKCCFKIYADDSELCDGGFTDWTAQMQSDGRETLLTSGMGFERLVQMVGS